jgi:hypothetical protein
MLGPMFGDYIATAIPPGGNAYPVIPVAKTPTGTTFHQAMYVPAGGLPITGGASPASAAHAHPGAGSSYAPSLGPGST